MLPKYKEVVVMDEQEVSSTLMTTKYIPQRTTKYQDLVEIIIIIMI